MPEQLEQALIRQATPSKLGGGCEVDSHGKKAGKGALVQTELSGTLGVSQDQTLISYGVTTKGNGDAFINPNTHTALTDGGGQEGQGYPCVLETKCLNPWDVQSKHIQPESGVAEALYSGECRYGGGESYVMQEQDVVCFEPGAASRVGGHIYEDNKAGTVRANAGDNQQAVVYGICSYDSNSMKSANPNSGIYEADTSRTLDNNGGNPACNQGGMMVLENQQQSVSYQEVVGTLSPGAHAGSYNGQDAYNDMLIVDKRERMEPVCIGNGQSDISSHITQGVAQTLNCMHDQQALLIQSSSPHSEICKGETFVIEGNGSRDSHKGNGYKESETMYTLNTVEQHAVCYGIDRAAFNQGQNAQYDFSVEEEKAQTIVARGPGGVMSKS